MRRGCLVVLLLLALNGVTLAGDTAWVVTTDYSSFGRIRSLGTAEPWTVSGDLTSIPGDAVARWHDGLVYVVGRGGANLLQVYDPANGFGLVREFSLGNGLNPQDIAFDSSGEAYVSCYDQAVLLRVDVAGETILGSYSTASYADADGIPETSWILAVGDTLYLTCQKLDRNNWYAPTGPGQLLVFDMVGESFSAPIDLVGADPYTRIEPMADGHLRVGCAGFFGVLDGGIEQVDSQSGLSLGYDVTESELGGEVTSFVTTGEGIVHAVVSDVSFITSLRKYDLNAGQLTILAVGSGYVYADVAYDGGSQIFLADRTPAAAGLRVFDTGSGGELTTGVVPTGLPPFMVVLPVEQPVSAVLPGIQLGDLNLAAPFPNPCNPRAELTLDGPPDTVVAVTVFDLRGHRINGAAVLLDATGCGRWIFNGLDTCGRRLPAGVYRVVAQNETGFAARSITLVK